jgi:ribokinase
MVTPKKRHIVVLGSLNIDLVAYVPHHPAPGETLTATSYAVSPGGKGANQAVACAKLSRARGAADDDSAASASVTMVGAVGDDPHGTLLLDNLRRHGVRNKVLARPGTKTGVAMIIVDEPTGQNRIVLSPEANHAMGSEDAKEASEVGPDLLIMQLEIKRDIVLGALSEARSAGVPVLLNPAPAVPLPDDALGGLAHLVMNETEAAVLAPCDEAELSTLEGLGRVARGFQKRGVKNVIITLGERGAYARAGDRWEGWIEPEGKVEVVDTTAAGDTWVGQYALEVVTGGDDFDVERAIRRANAAAAKTVQRKGAQDSIPWKDELE